MTLDTRVFVLDATDPQETFRHCRELLGATDRHTFTDGDGYLGNDPGQGLPAWLMLHYRSGAPLRTPEQAAEHDAGICNLPGTDWYDAESGPCDGVHGWQRACWLEISFDTAYGYRDERGFGCGDLHADIVSRLGQWLDERGVRWEWKNEFTGDVHGGSDRYARLVDLSTGGFEASAWFRTTVLPAIAADIARGGEQR